MAIISGICGPNDFVDNLKEMDNRLEQKLSKMSKKERDNLAYTASLFPSDFEDSEFGNVPKGWRVESLDQSISFLNGLALQKFPAKGDKTDLPILKIAQLKKGYLGGGEFASRDIPNKYIVTNGDLIFSWTASLMVKIWEGGESALNQHLFKVTSRAYPKWFSVAMVQFFILISLKLLPVLKLQLWGTFKENI